MFFDRNLGFAAAHNRLIERSRGESYLALNPDVVLEPPFVATVVAGMNGHPRTGAASGKLLRADDSHVLDSTGIVMHASQRHFDRGAGERDAGQFDRSEAVFGTSRRGRLLPARDARADAGGHGVFRRGFLRLSRGRRSRLARSAPRLGLPLRARGARGTRPARHARAPRGAPSRHQPLLGSQSLPAAAQEPDHGPCAALPGASAHARRAGGRLRAGARADVDGRSRRRRSGCCRACSASGARSCAAGCGRSAR